MNKRRRTMRSAQPTDASERAAAIDRSEPSDDRAAGAETDLADIGDGDAASTEADQVDGLDDAIDREARPASDHLDEGTESGDDALTESFDDWFGFEGGSSEPSDDSDGRAPSTVLERLSRISVHPDGGLEVADDDGHVLHYAPPAMTTGVRYLLARMRRESDADVPSAIGFTSTLSGEGVTVMARTFAAVLANDTGRSVCLVDLNWWTFEERTYRPDEELYGVYETLWMDKTLDAVLLDFPSDRFAYLPAGTAPASIRPTLAQHPHLPEVIEELAGRFDHLVFDLPAVTATSDAIGLSEFSDQIVLVVQQGVATRSQVQSALDDLGDARPVAAVLNRTRSSIPKFIRRLIGQ